MAKDDQGILFAAPLLEKLEPVATRRWQEAKGTDRLDEGQMPGMADGTAMLGPAVMRMARVDPGSLGGYGAVPNQEYEYQSSQV